VDKPDILYAVYENMEELCSNGIDVIWLELLAEEDKELDKIAIEITGEVNEESMYKNIEKDVIWIE